MPKQPPTAKTTQPAKMPMSPNGTLADATNNCWETEHCFAKRYCQQLATAADYFHRKQMGKRTKEDTERQHIFLKPVLISFETQVYRKS